MKKSTLGTIFSALNAAGIRYLIVGGFAVIAHGHLRTTADIDLVLGADPENLHKAISVLESLGFKSRAPVKFSEFADSEKRASWGRDKHMRVFTLLSSSPLHLEIDLFLEPPFDFEIAYANRLESTFAGGVTAHFCGLADLIGLKRVAGRPKDLVDIAELERIQREQQTNG